MTLIASILFLTALFASVMTIAFTVRDAMPRIADVFEAEFAPAKQTDRRISYGAVNQLNARRSAQIVAFPVTMQAETKFKLAA